ncbi:hypothetical protein M434DRAFT_392957 [Hypoxylon sp. CO27-5]|nr:hypothetical protein M434DRAFT_392957 [Hypoxylon sp. CO27-5]
METQEWGHFNWRGWFRSLGTRLRNRKTSGAMNDLEEAIRIVRDTLRAEFEADAVSGDHPDLEAWFDGPGINLIKKYGERKAIGNLEEAIRIERETVDATPQDLPQRQIILTQLGNRLLYKYLRTGNLEDLNESIRIGWEAVQLGPRNGAKDWVQCLSGFTSCLEERYARTSALADLEQTISLRQEIVDITRSSQDISRLEDYMSRLGGSLQDRYVRLGSTKDLDEAIQIARLTIDSNPNDRLKKGRLAGALIKRYSDLGSLDDLNEAISITLVITEEDLNHFNYVEWLSIISVGFSHQYKRTGDISYLDESIKIDRKAVDTALPTWPTRAWSCVNLGHKLYKRYSKVRSKEDLIEALSHYQAALQQLNSPITARMEASKAIFDICTITSDWEQAYEALNMAVDLIPKLIMRSVETSDKQHALVEVAGLASDGAAAALQAGKSPLVALNLLNRGRGVLASSLEEMRMDVSDLRDINSELIERFTILRDQLELPIKDRSSDSSAPEVLDESSWQVENMRRYEAGIELDGIIHEIYKRTGLQDVLSAPLEDDLRQAALHGPIAIINVNILRCDAILVEQSQIRSLALPKLQINEIKTKAQQDRESPEVLEWLWDVVAAPILNALGFVEPVPDGPWPHLWWIPTGPLCKFPLHAAGYHRLRSAESVIDRVMSSYSSSIKAIIQGRQRGITDDTQSHSSQALLVAMQDTPGLGGRLPCAAEEVEMVRGLCISMAVHPICPGQRKEDVVSHLPHSKIFHFAGHCETIINDPSQSHLLLEDWQDDPLTVSNLLDMNLRSHSPFLAYLSACGTGQVKDETWIDESIHLISACQLAGFRHAIGTLWEVSDETCVEMARVLYEVMRDEGMTDESVCKGLHLATRRLRNRWLDEECPEDQQKLSSDSALKDDSEKIRSCYSYGRNGRPQRDAAVCDDEDMGLLKWIPYVHFGV